MTDGKNVSESFRENTKLLWKVNDAKMTKEKMGTRINDKNWGQLTNELEV